MSEYDELVSGLRERAEHAATEGNMTATCDARYFAQSAGVIKALEAQVERLKGVLGIFAAIKADDGDTFDAWNDDVIIRCEVTAGDLKKARAALEVSR